MTEPIRPPEAPKDGDYTRATFEQVLLAVTGNGTDLRVILDTGKTPGKGWFTMSTLAKPGDEQKEGTSGGTGYSYHAWDDWFVNVDRDKVQPGNWTSAIEEIDGLLPGLLKAKLGLMDVDKLWDAKDVVDQYVAELKENHGIIAQWVKKLTSDDSAFKGKAAYSIRQNLQKIALTIDDLREQVEIERNTSAGLENTALALTTFSRGMADLWTQYNDTLRNLVSQTMDAVVNNVHKYILGMGLAYGTPNYALDILAMEGEERVLAYIKDVIAKYSSDTTMGPRVTAVPYQSYYPSPGGMPYLVTTYEVSVEEKAYEFERGELPENFGVVTGPLDQAATWDQFNVKISDYVEKQLAPLDTRARTLLAALQTAYERAKQPLDPVEPPIALVPGGGPPPGGGPNLPPPNGGPNLPPPNGGPNLPPPNGGPNLPPPNGGPNLPPPNGGPNLPPPNGGPNLPPPEGGSNLPPGTDSNGAPGGGGNDLPGGGDKLPPLGDSVGNQPPGGGNLPFVPLSALPGPLSNGSPETRRLDANGNPVDANGNPIDPPDGDGWAPPPIDGSLPPSTSNFDPSAFDLPGGNEDRPGNNFSNLPGGTSNVPGDGIDLPGGGSNLPGGFSNLPGGDSNLPGGFGNLPGGDSNLPGGFGNLPGGDSNLPGGLGNLPGGADLPGAISNAPGGGSNLPGGFDGLPGGGGGAPGGGFGNSPGGAGGFGGEGWSDWSGQDPSTGTERTPFAAPDASRPGGMPMMPPMMPPMSGNQGDSKERERQTWLSEDDKVWGTDSGAGNGIIGLPNDLGHDVDEPLAPTHVHVRGGTPRVRPGEPATAAKETTEQTATSQ